MRVPTYIILYYSRGEMSSAAAPAFIVNCVFPLHSIPTYNNNNNKSAGGYSRYFFSHLIFSSFRRPIKVERRRSICLQYAHVPTYYYCIHFV